MTWSPELETLDQLQAGKLALAVIRQLFPDSQRFTEGVLGLLSAGDVRLIEVEGLEVPDWRWRELFKDRAVLQQLDKFRLELTNQGVKRIG